MGQPLSQCGSQCGSQVSQCGSQCGQHCSGGAARLGLGTYSARPPAYPSALPILEESEKRAVAEALFKTTKNEAMKAAMAEIARGQATGEPIDVEKVYEAALEGAKLGAKKGGKAMTQQGLNVLIMDAAQYAAIVVLSEATQEAGRQTVYFGANTATQTALAGLAGTAAATQPMAWAAIVGQLSGKTVAWAIDGDEEVGSLVGAVGAAGLTGAFVGSSFGPAGALAGAAGGVAVGVATHYTGVLIDWTIQQVEDRLDPDVESDIQNEEDVVSIVEVPTRANEEVAVKA